MEVIEEFGTQLSIPGMYLARMVNGSPLTSRQRLIWSWNLFGQAEQAHRLIEFPRLRPLSGDSSSLVRMELRWSDLEFGCVVHLWSKTQEQVILSFSFSAMNQAWKIPRTQC